MGSGQGPLDAGREFLDTNPGDAVGVILQHRVLGFRTYPERNWRTIASPQHDGRRCRSQAWPIIDLPRKVTRLGRKDFAAFLKIICPSVSYVSALSFLRRQQS